MNQKQTERLADVRQQGIDALKGLSERLNSEQSILDCTDVAGLEEEEIKALFSYIRVEWRRRTGLHNFIKIDTFDDDGNLRGRISGYFDDDGNLRGRISGDTDNVPNSKPISGGEKSKPPENDNKNLFPLVAVAGLMTVTGLLLLYQHSPASSPNKPVVVIQKSSSTIPILETNKLIVGVLGDTERYSKLESYLKHKCGDRVQIQFEGSSKTDYQKAKDKIASNEWDIVFTLSPAISIAAKDNGYAWAAKMFANKPPFYQSVLFVRADSPIRSLEDIKPKTVIALGDFNSASSFYMPSYTLYGKKLTVERGHRGQEIREMVKSGKADIGAAAYGDIISYNNSGFRIIHKSRNIPGSGVYLSPKLSPQDRQTLTDALRQAPRLVKDDKQANYEAGEEPDYSPFRQITNRVESILTCVDWKQKQIAFYCPEKDTGIAGKVISALPSSTDSNQAHLELRISDRQTYRVLLPLSLINQIPGGGSLLNLKNKQVRLIDVKPSKGSDDKLKIKIDRASQIKIQQ
jgi:ABC-type phosphate/phosphonate transport system substrate-binding protein